MAADEGEFEVFGRWFWISAAVIAACCVGLVVAYYVRHPDRNLFEDFARRGPLDVPSTNGHVPGPPASVSSDADGGEAAG